MRLWSDSFTEGGVIPPECAFARIEPATHVGYASNRNPHLGWDEVPSGTQSLALFCRDVDAPAVKEGMNEEGKLLAEDLPRIDFYHWTLVDIPVAIKSLGEGKLSEMVTPHGKPGPLLPFTIKNGTEHQLRQGLNDYTALFVGDPDMAGEYFGYDGPFPPWNDLRPHAYLFCLYALDVPFPLEGSFTGPQARLAIRGHILDEAQVFGVYSLNPEVAESLAK
ncbi:MAG: YbhB/YbcL family Raf kinase inhibitor-like protein [Telluria sp.]